MASPDALLLDFDALRQRGIGLLQRLAGSTWTDHNAHDPGITLLETLCYVLTDLGYRTGFPVPDLLATAAEPGVEGDAVTGSGSGVYTPAQVLPSGPVTTDDLRRIVIDLPGVKNAWVERVDTTLAHHDAAQGLVSVAAASAADSSGAAPSPNVSDLRPHGLYRVRIEKSGLGEDIDGGALTRLAAERLQQWRGLGEDLADIAVLDPQPVALDAAIEISAGADAAELLAGLYEAVAGYLSPPLPLHSLDELLQRGWRVDQIFEGPLLSRGFLDPAEWAAVERRSALRLSDLIQALMAVPGVVAIKRLGFLRDGQPSSDWVLPVAAERCARFDLAGSSLRLERRGQRIDHDGLRATARRVYEARARLAGREAGATTAHDLPAPAGRPRQTGRYLSLMHHLPAVYGVGPAGLSSTEPVERQARAWQLKAYLMLFDQLLANQFAQLGQVRQLLSFNTGSARASFAQPVPDEGGVLGLDGLRRQPTAAHRDWLDTRTEDPWGDGSGSAQALARRHRLLDHLLARLGERWAAPDPAGDDASAPAARALQDKLAFLRDYPGLALRRGLGADQLAEAGTAPPAGLAQRLALLLGLADPAETPILLEHILLRPLPGDVYQQGPWLRGVASRDPFSLQLTLVLPAQGGRLADADLRQHLQQAVADEAPAHLAVRLLWLDDAAMAAFSATHARWRGLWREAQRRRFGLDDAAGPAPGADHQCALRSARNRVIDALGLGDSFPLTDLVVADGGAGGPIKVAHGRSARIAIDAAERGVRYTLRGPDGQPLKGADGQPLPPVWVDGNGGRVLIETPPITDDISFRIQATKLQQPAGLPPQPPVWLAQLASVQVGLDTRLLVELPDLPLLDATLAEPQPGDARLAAYGDRARVLVHQSQEGVSYALVVDGVVQDDTVIGDLGSISLHTPPLREDCVLAVQATKLFGGAAQAEQQLLDARLVLAVKADPGRVLQVVPGPVLGHGQADAWLRVQASQASARYQLYARPVRDAEWQRAAADGGTGLLLADADHPGVLPPQRPDSVLLPAGFLPLGAGPLAGNGADLDLPLGAPVRDLVVLVQASKQHPVGGQTLGSEIGLQQPVLLLTRPDPDPALQLALVQDRTRPGAAVQLQVAGGQAGVFYRAQVQPDGPALPLPAYVHQRDDQNAELNKGLGQLAVGIDLVVVDDAAAGAPPVAGDSPPRDRLPPATPLLDLPDGLARELAGAPAGAADTVLAWQAVKAQTGADVALARTLRLQALPEVAFDPPVLAAGQSSRLRIAASAASRQYQLLRQGQALADPVPGNGAELVLETGAVDADVVFELRSSPVAADDGLPLQQRLTLALWQLPRADLGLAPARNPLPRGEATEIVVTDSQPGVRYQLLAGPADSAQPVGEPVVGGADRISLPTGALSADTRFSVRATRIAEARASVLLAADLLLTLAPVA